MWAKVEQQGVEYGWPDEEVFSQKQQVAIKNFRGIDKDYFLAKVAKAYMAILGDGRGGVHCENSLDDPRNWSDETKADIALGTFDVVMTNPPFGKKLSINSQAVLKQYALGHKWTWDKRQNRYVKGKVADKQAPQILFIERCLDLLRPGGRLGIVLLESIFGMPKYGYVVDYLTRRTRLRAIVTLPEDLFQPNTHAKTCVLICEKVESPVVSGMMV